MMSHAVLCCKLYIVVVVSTALIACGAAPASVLPVQSNAASTASTAQPAPTSTPATSATAATLGQPFTLALGQSVQVAGTDLTLRLAAVSEDSRCPRGVDCVWEGQVTATLDVTPASQAVSQIALTLRGSGRQVAESRAPVGEHTVQIEAVAPYPEIGTDIAADDYVATLRVK